MRGFGKLAAAPCRPTTAAASAFAAKQSFLSSTSACTYSTFSDGGGGRGRGRGSGPPPQAPPPPRVPGQTKPDNDDDAFVTPGLGHGRGHPVLPSSPVLPSFSSWMSSPPPFPAAAGRGRGRPLPPQDSGDSPPDSHLKKPIFFRREDSDPPPGKTPSSDPESSAPLPPSFVPVQPGAGRGKPTKPAGSDARPTQENRHLRPRAPVGSPERRPSPSQPKLGSEEAVRKAMEVLNRSGGGTRGRGRQGDRGMTRGRSRGRGRSNRSNDAFEDSGLYLGDNADGERLKKRLGEEKMKKLDEEFDEISWRVLPSPLDDAYLDALHTNNMIEYEPEYLVEFDKNPDIDEKPPMSLEDALEKMKPFLMAYEGIQSQEEWEEIIKETMEKVPYMKELMDMYCGPDRVTAKQQQQELERVAKTLPENIPSSVKRFADRAVLSLQSNPGWGWDKKCQFMDKLVWEVSQHHK